MAPFDLTQLAGPIGQALVFGAIGFGFGAVLEMTGFGDTRKLAGQFYFRELTVLKTMFTAIVVAAVLLFLASSLGLLDLGRVWVNPTYLWPGIAGGLVMGVGFVVGGFCPGTSLVAAATLKLDGILFVAGALFGVWAFGETVAGYQHFWLSSYMGRFTLPDWLGITPGATVLAIVAMALAMFWMAEALERRFAPAAPLATAPVTPRHRRIRRVGAGALAALAVLVAARGEPDAETRWARAPAALQQAVADRTIFVDPAEVVALRKDLAVRVEVLDVRAEHEFNLFHAGGARRVDLADLDRPEELKRLRERPSSTVTFVTGNGEERALEAWKRLRTQGVPNVYVVAGGVNRWLELYPVPECVATRATVDGPDQLAFRFSYATGASLPSAAPELAESHEFRFPCEDGAASHDEGAVAHHGFTWPDHPFTKRVKLQTRAAVKGGCG
jgi:rhodanese-related sulfurtransferase